MVLKLKLASPAKFYGSSLPRPRIYNDIKFSLDRVDPPLPVLDPLFYWAYEAHWSMGGHRFKRLRLQGQIEGHVDKLRKSIKKTTSSPPPAVIAAKRRRKMVPLIDEDEEEEEDLEEVEAVKGKRLVKKLVDEFDRVAAEEAAAASRTRSRKVEAVDEIETVMQVVKEVKNLNLKGKNNSKLKKKGKNKNKNKGHRSSPRLPAKV